MASRRFFRALSWWLASRLCLIGAAGWAAIPATAEPGRLEAARLEWNHAQAEVARLQGVQSVLRAELRQLSAEIEQNKQQGERGGLEERLRRNQELSYRLSTLARELSTAETRGDAARTALSGALSVSLESLQHSWEASPDRAARQALVTQMRTLRGEREELREGQESPALLANEPVGALAAMQALDDPRELLEQADALRDAEDKVRERLRQLDLRIAEARQERELDRRMGQYLDERVDTALDPPRVLAVPAIAAAAREQSPTPAPGPAETSELPDSSDLRVLEEQRVELRVAAEKLHSKAAEYELRARQLK